MWNKQNFLKVLNLWFFFISLCSFVLWKGGHMHPSSWPDTLSGELLNLNSHKKKMDKSATDQHKFNFHKTLFHAQTIV